MNAFKAILFGLVTLVPVAGALAAETHSAHVDQLRTARQKVARAAGATKGGPRHLLLQEQQRLGTLIQDLESGKAVDPAEIDRALERAERGGL